MFGDVPTHGPWCQKVQSYGTRCSSCRAAVIYFECTCGSRVFLSPGGGGEHACGSARSVSVASARRRPVASAIRGSERCRSCGARVRQGRLNEHLLRCPGSPC